MKTATLGVLLVLAGAQEPEVMPLKVGATWDYTGMKGGKPARETWEISKTEKKGDVECFVLKMIRKGGQPGDEGYTLFVRSTKEGIRIEDAVLKNISDEERFLIKLPLTAGAKSSLFLSAPAEAVVGPKTEEIAVPAGKFTCSVLSHVKEYPGTQMKSRAWIAKGVGFFKF